MKFYRCAHCGNIIVKVEDSGVPVVCCGEAMGEVVANTVDAALEKHVPIMEVNGDLITVKVGSVLHPMEQVHYITFIAIVTKSGFQIKYLKPGEEPVATFKTDEDVTEVYEYCNLHGLWKLNI